MSDILNVDLSEGIKNIDVNTDTTVGKVDFISDNGSDNNSVPNSPIVKPSEEPKLNVVDSMGIDILKNTTEDKKRGSRSIHHKSTFSSYSTRR